MVKTVINWQSIPQLPDHECGWVGEPHEYVRPTCQLAIRWLNKKKGGWFYCVMFFNLTNELFFEFAHLPMPEIYTELDLISVIVDAYDLRGGGVETSYKNSKFTNSPKPFMIPGIFDSHRVKCALSWAKFRSEV